MGVTGCGLDLEDTLLNGETRHIEGTTSKIKDQDILLTNAGGFLVNAISNDGSSGLIDDTEDIDSGNNSGILGCLTLGVIKVGRNCDNSVLDGAAKVGLGDVTHLDEDHGEDFLSGEGLVFSLVRDSNHALVTGAGGNLEWPQLHVALDRGIGNSTTNQPLSIEDGVNGVHGDLILGGISDQPLGISKSDIRRGGFVTLVVGNDLNTVVLPDTDA
ncbi:hypothetical protein EV1_022365 [Malus domestica]